MKSKTQISLFPIVMGIGILVLIISFFRCPYWYYTLVRIVTMIVAAYLVYKYCAKKRFLLALVCILVIAAFQPFYKLPVGRVLWGFIDFAVLMFWCYSIGIIYCEEDGTEKNETDSAEKTPAMSKSGNSETIRERYPRIWHNESSWDVRSKRHFTEAERSVISKIETFPGEDGNISAVCFLTTGARIFFSILEEPGQCAGSLLDKESLELVEIYNGQSGTKKILWRGGPFLTQHIATPNYEAIALATPTPIEKKELEEGCLHCSDKGKDNKESQDQIHIGWIKFLAEEGYGFIVDLVDNSEYFFHISHLNINPLPSTLVTFLLRKSKRHTDKFEAYSIAPIPHRKSEILEMYFSLPDGVKKIVGYEMPSILYGFDTSHEKKALALLKKYELLIADLYDYVASFDLEAFLDAYYVKTDFYYSASTKDWDWNILSYKGFVGDAYSKLEGIYARCSHYEESLVWEWYQVKQRTCGYSCFDPYLVSISDKREVIKQTRAYGVDSHFGDDLDDDKIKAKIPALTEKWRREIRKEYSKEKHFKELTSRLYNRFFQLYDYIPFYINKDGIETRCLYGPGLNVTLEYPNGYFRIEPVRNSSKCGFSIEHLSNDKKTTATVYDSQNVDADFDALGEYETKMREKYKGIFSQMIEKYKFKEIQSIEEKEQNIPEGEADQLNIFERECRILINSAQQRVATRNARGARELLDSIVAKINRVKDPQIQSAYEQAEILYVKLLANLEQERIARLAEERRRIEEERRREEEARIAAQKEGEERKKRERAQREEENRHRMEEARKKEQEERAELNRLKSLSNEKKDNWQSYASVLEENDVMYFYHFTDRRNLPSIKRRGGLLSWDYCDKHDITIPYQGGDDTSRSLDRRYGLQDYVRLSLCKDHPMMYRLTQSGYDLVILKIRIDVAWFRHTCFSDMNATDGSHTHGGSLADLERINFDATKQQYLRSDDPLFKLHQAEVLVKTFVPIEYIENIDRV